jgi:hypothetical protein
MMAMSALLVLLVCLLPLVLFLKWTRRFRESYSDVFGYLLSLIGTFVVVFVGLYFTDLQSTKDKKATAVKVLEASLQELKYFERRAAQIEGKAETTYSREEQKFMQLELPPFFSHTLRTELMAEALHPLSVEQFNLIRENLLFDAGLIRKDALAANRAQLQGDLADYRSQVQIALAVIQAEIERLQDQVAAERFESEARERLGKLTKG